MTILRAKIVIVPLGEADLTLVNRLAGSVGGVFNRGVDILKGMKIPEEAFNETRNQYYARIILSKLERIKANTRETVIGICEQEMYLPSKNFVLGYADNLSSVAVVSLFNFRNEFYGLPEDDKKVYPRLYKEVIHQMANLYSITACNNPGCVHYDSTDMLDIDQKSNKLCDICIRNFQQVHAT